jgi:hypothetical protein
MRRAENSRGKPPHSTCAVAWSRPSALADAWHHVECESLLLLLMGMALKMAAQMALELARRQKPTGISVHRLMGFSIRFGAVPARRSKKLI